jgi:hypothetical protein
MLNTGLALRQPGDSLYSRLRCFFMSNWGVPLAVIRQELHRLSKPGQVTRPGHLLALVEQHQREYCRRYRIPYASSDALPLSAAVRTCPVCAVIGYHSIVFQWPWLSRCPVHGVALTLTCPVCGRPWPSAIQLARCQCHGCGWRSPYDPSVATSLDTAAYSCISVVANYARATRALPQWHLIAASSFSLAQNEHSPPTLSDPLFASTYGQRSSQVRVMLWKFGVHMTGMRLHRFPRMISAPCRALLMDSTYVARQDQVVRDRVAARLHQRLAAFGAQPPPCTDLSAHDYEGIDRHTNCYHLAYAYWCTLVNAPARAEIHWGYASRYFELNGKRQYPLIPQPMCYMIHDVEAGLRRDESPRHLLPLGMRNLIYELDLWLCFKALVKYFDTLKAAQECLGWSSMHARLPAWARPGAPYGVGISAYREGPDTLVLQVPRHYYRLEFDDLTLHEVHPDKSMGDRCINQSPSKPPSSGEGV